MYTGTSNVILAKRWLWLPDDGLWRHNTEYGYNDTYTGTSNVILAKRWL
jgi:hypothetical protein